MYQALYRKWRPKTFSDVVGQPHITETLRKQVAEGRTSHAYLFTGTRGTGKTTCAKILAKAVNCEHPEDGNPCNRCASCLGIENGSFLDVLELDAASNNGVDQVRALRDEAIYAPANVKKRVYIVDEVHMLSVAAFNALLKILEEPPEHLMFILATTELHKVPATILSRCQRFSFKRITPGDIAKRMRYVAGQESIDLTPDGAELLSRLADGALRDALSLLDQCAAAGGTVDSRAVLDTLGLAGNLQTARLMDQILHRDAQAALLLLNELYSGGKDVGAVLSELSTLTRDLLLRKTAPEGGSALLSGGFDGATLEQLGDGVSSPRLLYLTATLQKTIADLYYSSNRRTDAELCLLRLCDESLSGDLTALSARIAHLEETVSSLSSGAGAASLPRTSAPAASRPTGKRAAHPAVSKDVPPWEAATPAASAEPPLAGKSPLPNEPPLPEEPPLPDESPLADEHGEERVFDIPAQEPGPARDAPPPAAPSPSGGGTGGSGWWRSFAEGCKGRMPAMYRAFLDHCNGTLADGVLTVYTDTDMTKNRLNNDRILGILQEAGEQASGGPVQVRLTVGEGPQSSPEERMQNLIRTGSKFDSFQIK